MAVPGGHSPDRRVLARRRGGAGRHHLSADSFDKVLELLFEWNDVFDIDIHPAVSAEEGLRIGPEVFGRLPRMQQQP
jgi:hypothetical protein